MPYATWMCFSCLFISQARRINEKLLNKLRVLQGFLFTGIYIPQQIKALNTGCYLSQRVVICGWIQQTRAVHVLFSLPFVSHWVCQKVFVNKFFVWKSKKIKNLGKIQFQSFHSLSLFKLFSDTTSDFLIFLQIHKRFNWL